ncbi:hypothetical protein M9Y10_029085 [Tritrichomonas musculus]|uniref:RING-type domain-containing protein n=1 Tax=Tritrichomonas musculus TaxID=1915356 RepID=A0ABR2KL44_9EUKA
MDSMSCSNVCALCGNRISYHSCSLPCNHQFCQICISKWCTQSNSCPSCNKKYTRLNELINNSPTGFIFSAKALAKLYETTNSNDDNLNSSSLITDSSTFQAAQQYRSDESIEQIDKPSFHHSRNSIYSSALGNKNTKNALPTKQKEWKKSSLMPKLVLSSIQS